MSNEWAQRYSTEMGWPISPSLTAEQIRCDVCGAITTRDKAWPTEKVYVSIVRPMLLESDYCFGCGLVICQDCEDRKKLEGDHQQSDHRP